MALRLVRWRFREHDAQQRVELAQTIATQTQLHVERSQPREAGDAAGRLQCRTADSRIDFQRIGCAFFAQRQHRAATAVCIQREPAETTLDAEIESCIATAVTC